MHVYWATTFIIPKGVLAEIEKLCYQFLWDSTEKDHKPAFVGWDSVCLPKKFRGLRLKHPGVWNLAAIGKKVWALASKAHMLWVQWISKIYLKHTSFMDAPIKDDSSWNGKQLLKARDCFGAGFIDD